MANTINTKVKAKLTEKTGTDTYTQYLPETVVEQITSEGAIAGQNAGATLATILNSLYQLAQNGGVLSVNGKTGAVTITLTDLGFDTYASQITNAQNKADQAYNLAAGNAKATAYDTVEAMKAALKSANNTAFKVGDQLLIKDTGVPDYWISAVLSTNTGETGYYEISELEGKTDLTNYPTKADLEAVKTTANNAQSTADTANNTANANKTDITNIKNGATEVGKANQLANARNIILTGDMTGSASFDGTADASINATLKNSSVNPGTYSAVQVNAKGIVEAGQQMLVFADSLEDTALNNLAIGGLAVIGA